MFRTLVVLLAFTGSAVAGPTFSEKQFEDSRLACVSGLTSEQHEKIWNGLIRQLEQKNYKRETWAARDNGDFSDGNHTVFVSQAAEGICIQYFSADQPQIPMMHEQIAASTAAYAAQDYCPEGLPYSFTKFRDVLLINRMNHKAFCTNLEGDNYECLEKWLVDDEPSVYKVRAQFTADGKLLFTTEPEGDFWPAIGECE